MTIYKQAKLDFSAGDGSPAPGAPPEAEGLGMHPAAAAALLFGGGGALAGALANMHGGVPGESAKQRTKRILKGLLVGGSLGAAGGAAAGFAGEHTSKAWTDKGLNQHIDEIADVAKGGAKARGEPGFGSSPLVRAGTAGLYHTVARKLPMRANLLASSMAHLLPADDLAKFKGRVTIPDIATGMDLEDIIKKRLAGDFLIPHTVGPGRASLADEALFQNLRNTTVGAGSKATTPFALVRGTPDPAQSAQRWRDFKNLVATSFKINNFLDLERQRLAMIGQATTAEGALLKTKIFDDLLRRAGARLTFNSLGKPTYSRSWWRPTAGALDRGLFSQSQHIQGSGKRTLSRVGGLLPMAAAWFAPNLLNAAAGRGFGGYMADGVIGTPGEKGNWWTRGHKGY